MYFLSNSDLNSNLSLTLGLSKEGVILIFEKNDLEPMKLVIGEKVPELAQTLMALKESTNEPYESRKLFHSLEHRENRGEENELHLYMKMSYNIQSTQAVDISISWDTTEDGTQEYSFSLAESDVEYLAGILVDFFE